MVLYYMKKDSDYKHLPYITKDFLKENQQHKISQNCGKKRGGPYSLKQRFLRRQEVYRLHFDLGLSAIKIAELMNFNRNTISGDIEYWYSKLVKEWGEREINVFFMKQIHRLEIDRNRVRESLTNQKEAAIRLSTERLLFDIDCRIAEIVAKAMKNWDDSIKIATTVINDWAKKNNFKDYFLDKSLFMKLSKKQFNKIKPILEEAGYYY